MNTTPAAGRATYFERCWPNADLIESFEFVRLIEAGDEVVVTYESTKTDGSRFSNTEVLTFDGDKISKVEGLLRLRPGRPARLTTAPPAL